MRTTKCWGFVAVVLAVTDCALGSLLFRLTPQQPTTATPVSVTAYRWFGDTGQELVSATYSRTGGQINMEVVMWDHHGDPNLLFLYVLTQGGGTVDLGSLTQGHYDVNATMYTIPWWAGPPLGWDPWDPYYDPALRQFLDQGAVSFDVVPEPTTLAFLALGVLAVTRRKRMAS